MSLRDSFWFLAGALIAAAVLLAANGTWRRQHSLTNNVPVLPAIAVAALSACGVLGIALGIYFLLGPAAQVAANSAPVSAASLPVAPATPEAHNTMVPARDAGSLDEVTQKLAARLAAGGGLDSDWKLLAQSYEYLGRPEDARKAQAHSASAQPADLATVAAALDGLRGGR